MIIIQIEECNKCPYLGNISYNGNYYCKALYDSEWKANKDLSVERESELDRLLKLCPFKDMTDGIVNCQIMMLNKKDKMIDELKFKVNELREYIKEYIEEINNW